ncbi:MAG TPA: M20/M25/M40 family metallo-hydrolase [Ignavibacteria bacterium]|nr:aminopeptidase [Bacteroidota bacterium]HRI85113.1 M20/M25/M40 family metallo-hydrolase [Ignavibacteria bacterium]HRK00299.1 M20/M25/M40 family metallo-hydrolase [Ignavibacteria bacterium]
MPKINRISLITIFLVSLSLYSFFPQDGKDGIEGLRSNNISSPEIYQHIKYLSSDELEGRFPGTQGDALTSDYLINEFKTYGLKPYGENEYVQNFDVYTHISLSGNNYFKTTSDGKDKDYIIETQFTPLGFSGNGTASGQMVFAGYGISAADQNYDDYKDKDGNEIDIKGKILVIMKYSPGGSDPHSNPFEKYEALRQKTHIPKERGAAGIIFINGPSTGDDDKLTGLKFDRVLQDAGIPVINCKRDIIENILANDGKDLKTIQEEIDKNKTSNSFEIKNSYASFETNIEPVKAVTDNVIGMIEGNDPVLKNEVIVIGGHKDHLGYGLYGSLYSGSDRQIHNGADDNASGIAGVLELAQKFSSVKKDLKRSILFICFGAEEAGLIGSAYFTNSKLFEELNVVAMINMDMVGRLSDDKLIIYGTGTSPLWNELLDKYNTNYNFNLTKTPDGLGPSDHSSFYIKDVPSLHFFTGTHGEYHAPHDDIEKINAEGQLRIMNYIYDIVSDLDDRDLKPEFTKVVVAESNEKRSMGSVKIYVGTIPDYSFTGEGMKISGVKQGGPAETGGMLAGDIIVKFGNTDVKNIYDYMFAMGGFKPGDEAEITVIRNNEPVVLKIKMGSR